MNEPTTSLVTLIVRRTIAAPPARLFAAWTEPDQLVKWWGPKSVTCPRAEVDLRVGGRYRIANRFPDGKTIWIAGEFELIAPPRQLIYTWRLEPESGPPERVTIKFEPHGDATEVIVQHERIATPALRDRHEQGWFGCLDGLENYLGGTRESMRPT